MQRSSFLMPDIGIPADRQTVEEQAGSQGAPVVKAPFPILLLIFLGLGYLFLRKVWLD